MEGLENELWRRWSAYDVGEVTESLENQNELWRRWSDWKLGEWAELILQAFCRFIYITAHFPTFPLLYLHHSSFSNPSVASPTSQLILQPFFRFSYVTGFSLTSPGELPMLQPFFCFSYVTSSSLNSSGEPPMVLCDKYEGPWNATFHIPRNERGGNTKFVDLPSLSSW